MEIAVEYDSYGRMKYNPDYHANNGKSWDREDVEYLIEWYDLIGPEEMSFALERTIKTVMQRATELRKKSLMRRPTRHVWHSRIQK